MFFFQVLIPAAAASGEIHAGLQRFTRSDQEFVNCVSSAEPQLPPAKMDSGTEDRTDNRPLPPTYVCVFRTFRTFWTVLTA